MVSLGLWMSTWCGHHTVVLYYIFGQQTIVDIERSWFGGGLVEKLIPKETDLKEDDLFGETHPQRGQTKASEKLIPQRGPRLSTDRATEYEIRGDARGVSSAAGRRLQHRQAAGTAFLQHLLGPHQEWKGAKRREPTAPHILLEANSPVALHLRSCKDSTASRHRHWGFLSGVKGLIKVYLSLTSHCLARTPCP